MLPRAGKNALDRDAWSGRYDPKEKPPPPDMKATEHAEKMAAQSAQRFAQLGRAAATGQRRKVYHRRKHDRRDA